VIQALFSEAKLRLWSRFEAQREAGSEENGRFAGFRERLIDETLSIPEGARKRIFGDDSISHLVRDENDWAAKPGDALRQFPRRSHEIRVLNDEPAEPQREAINDDNSVWPGFPAKRGGQRDRFFDERPAPVPRRGMTGDPLGHLAIACFRRRDQDGMAPRGFRETLRIAAFARPRATEDKKAADGRIWHAQSLGDDLCG
jgi:hypothetical protein